MKAKTFFGQLDHDKMVAAIAEAEKHTTGEIRVYVSHHKVADAQKAAMHQFQKLQMHKTKHRNAVLIFVAPESQNFAIIGDEAVHAKCGEEFWQRVAGEMAESFRQSKFTDGISHGVRAAGKLLAQHFPRHGTDENELPDSVIER